MTKQFSFAEFDPPPPRLTDRLFYAVFPDAAAAERIAQRASHFCADYGVKGKPLEAGRLHATLHHLGDYAGEPPPDVVAAALKAAAAIAAAPFDVTFDRITSSGRSRGSPLVLCGRDGVAELMAFQGILGAAMIRNWLRDKLKPRFTPHVTLLYGEHDLRDQAVEPLGWTVREFVLIRSLFGQTRHIVLGRWPLLG